MKKSLISLIIFIFSSCMGQVDKSKLRGNDYRLFQGTPISELASALRINSLSEVEKIVESKSVNLNYQEQKYGQTLLMLTVKNRQYEMCKKLLELGANPNLHDTFDGTSAIIDAASLVNDDGKFVRLLLDYGANPNDEEVGDRREGNSRRETPLLNASETSLEAVKILIDAGADINHRNEFSTVTPLNESIIQGRYSIALYLLEKGADPNICVFHRANKNIKNSKGSRDIYIVDLLREKMIPLDSEDYLLKMKIIELLKSKGIEYKKVEIPDFIVERAKKLYPNSWQDYLSKY
jgi:ankyrin repeat protein